MLSENGGSEKGGLLGLGPLAFGLRPFMIRLVQTDRQLERRVPRFVEPREVHVADTCSGLVWVLVVHPAEHALDDIDVMFTAIQVHIS